MCGIVAYVGSKDCAPILVEGLRRLEYRGYDSAGLAVHTGRGRRDRPRRREAREPRRGAPEAAAPRNDRHRPHALGDPRAAERSQRAPARRGGRRARPQRHHREPRRAPPRPRGARACASRATPTRRSSPTSSTSSCDEAAAGKRARVDAVRVALKRYAAPTPSRSSAASPRAGRRREADSPARPRRRRRRDARGERHPRAPRAHTRGHLPPRRRRRGRSRKRAPSITTARRRAGERAAKRIDWSPTQAEKGGFKHFMLKEIHEQPRAVEDTLRGRVDLRASRGRRARRSALTPEIAKINHARLLRRVRHELARRDGGAILGRAAREAPVARSRSAARCATASPSSRRPTSSSP